MSVHIFLLNSMGRDCTLVCCVSNDTYTIRCLLCVWLNIMLFSSGSIHSWTFWDETNDTANVFTGNIKLKRAAD